MPDNRLTKRQLKQKISKTSIEEVISGLDLELAEHAVDVKDQDLIEVADMVQAHEGPKTKQFMRILSDKKIHVFHNFAECKIKPKTRIEMILIDDVYVLKVLKEKEN